MTELSGQGIELVIPPTPEFLQLVRAVVGAAAGLSGGASSPLDPGRVADLRLVVSEAVTNAIEAQGLIGASDRIFICCRVADDHVVVEVVDHGPGFDPDSLPELPDVETPERLHYESGLGVALMRRLSDEAVVESGPRGTTVRLTIRSS
ncbi:MAG: ATP-binding protein [Acidimicrobiales bacterium]|nr:ATP-binding protein [Acidimicrobiales bacterium]